MTDKELLIKIKADTGKATKEINRLNKELGKLSKSSGGKWSKGTQKGFDGVTKSVKALNTQLIGLATTFLSIQGAKALITTAADIEEGFLNVAKTTGMVGEELDDFKDKLLELSTEMAGVSVEELQSIAEVAGQMGIEGSENILKFTETLAMVGVTTEMTAEQAALAFGKLAGTMDTPIEQVGNMASAVNELSNNYKVNATEILAMSQKMSGVAKTFGLTTPEVMALSTSLTEMGLQAELGGTAMSTIMLAMLKDVKGFAAASGVSFDEFSKMVKEKPVEALNTFFTALSKMDQSTKLKVLDDLKLKGSGVVQVSLKMAGSIDKVREAQKTSNEAFKDGTSHLKEYETFSKGFNAQMTKVGNIIKVLASKLTEKLLPSLRKTAEEFGKWVDSLSDEDIKKYAQDIDDFAQAFFGLVKSVGSVVVPIAGFVADNAKLLAGLLLLKTSIATLSGIMTIFGTKAVAGTATNLTTAATASSAFGTALSKLPALITPITAATTLLGTAILTVVDDYAKFQKQQNEMASKDATALNKQVEGLQKVNDLLQKAKEEEINKGAASQESANKAEQALKAQIDALQIALDGMHSNTAATIAAAEQLGQLQALYDTFPEQIKTKIEIEDPNAADMARIAKEIESAPPPKIEPKVDMGKELEKAKKEVGKIEPDPIKAKLKVGTKEAKNDISKIKPDPIKAKVDLDAKEANAVKKDLEKPITTDLGFDPNTSAADSARQQVAKPIIVPVTYLPTGPKPAGTFAGGGAVPKLASGGTFKGSGKVGGYDPTDSDKVNAKLTGGEYVIKRKAVDTYGASLLNAINTMSFDIPVRRFAEGGFVDIKSSVVSSTTLASNSPQLQPINITFPNHKKYDLYSDGRFRNEVANALTEYINMFGGI